MSEESLNQLLSPFSKCVMINLDTLILIFSDLTMSISFRFWNRINTYRFSTTNSTPKTLSMALHEVASSFIVANNCYTIVKLDSYPVFALLIQKEIKPGKELATPYSKSSLNLFNYSQATSLNERLEIISLHSLVGFVGNHVSLKSSP
jgi:hypothetical protein